MLEVVAEHESQGLGAVPALYLIAGTVPAGAVVTRSRAVSGRRALQGLVDRGYLLDSTESFSVPLSSMRLYGRVRGFSVLLDDWEAFERRVWDHPMWTDRLQQELERLAALRAALSKVQLLA